MTIDLILSSNNPLNLFELLSWRNKSNQIEGFGFPNKSILQ